MDRILISPPLSLAALPLVGRALLHNLSARPLSRALSRRRSFAAVCGRSVWPQCVAARDHTLDSFAAHLPPPRRLDDDLAPTSSWRATGFPFAARELSSATATPLHSNLAQTLGSAFNLGRAKRFLGLVLLAAPFACGGRLPAWRPASISASLHPSLRAALGRWQVRSRTNVARRAQRRLRIRHCPDARHFCSGRSTMSPALRPGWRGTAFFPLPSRSDARRGGWVAVAPTDARNAPGDAPGNDRHGPILQTLSSRSHAATSRTCSGALPLVNAVRSVTFVCRPSGLVSAALRARAQPARHCRKLRSGVQRRDGAPNGVLALSFRAAKDMTGMNAAPRPLPHQTALPGVRDTAR